MAMTPCAVLVTETRLLNEARTGVDAVESDNSSVCDSSETKCDCGDCSRGQHRLHGSLLERIADAASGLSEIQSARTQSLARCGEIFACPPGVVLGVTGET